MEQPRTGHTVMKFVFFYTNMSSTLKYG